MPINPVRDVRYDLLIVDDPYLEQRLERMSTKDYSGQRFGRVFKDFGDLGELRKQKKAPHTEVLYIWIKQIGWPIPDDVVDWKISKVTLVLRSVNNCTNTQLTDAIQMTGNYLTDHRCSQTDAELILDILYKELGRRVEKCAI